MPYRSERIEFPGSQGHNLAARLDWPAGRIRAFALFAHCFTCGKDLKGPRALARSLAARGIAVLRFDFTGLGHSEGEFANTHFTSNVEDIVAAADYLRQEHSAPGLLIGHSFGGTAVLAAAGQIPEVQAIATLGAPAEPTAITRHFTSAIGDIESQGEAEVELAGRAFRIRDSFLNDVKDHRLDEAISRLGRALLVLHAPRDEIVDIDNASRIFLAAKHPKSFVSLDDADHLLSRSRDATYAAEVVAAWASRYLPESEPTQKNSFQGVIVRESGRGALEQDIEAGQHRLIADEPPEVGGGDAGPDPYAYLLAALGACTSMTLRLYADHKKWPLEQASVRLTHRKVHAKDCEDCETRDGKVDWIERSLVLKGSRLSGDQRKRLVEIAERCPVHRTLHSEVRVDTKLIEHSEEQGSS